ncbi:MAG: PHP domain-containing protein [Nanoarchaeota archaeon]|nr:PHP domain-containing protein [Nanoarchaeota archaeon]
MQPHPIKLVFDKPDIDAINAKGNLCIDMHFHTRYSDGAAKLKHILKNCTKQDLGVAITDHNEIRGAILAQKLANEAKIIQGIEIKDQDGIDILAYFYDSSEIREFFNKTIKNDKKGFWVFAKVQKKTDEIIDILKNYNCITSYAHPFEYREKPNDKYVKKIDSMEIFNSRLNEVKNIRALALSEKEKKCTTGGSDGHSIYELGLGITYSKAESTDEFLDNIRKKKNYVIGKPLKNGAADRLKLHIKNRAFNLVKWN